MAGKSENSTSAASRPENLEAAEEFIKSLQLGKVAENPLLQAISSPDTRPHRLYTAATSPYAPVLSSVAAALVGLDQRWTYLGIITSMLPEDNGGLDFTRLPGETEKSWNARVEHYEQAGEKWPDHHRQFVSSCAALIAALGAHTAVSMAGLSADSQMVSTQAAGTLAKHLSLVAPLIHNEGSREPVNNLSREFRVDHHLCRVASGPAQKDQTIFHSLLSTIVITQKSAMSVKYEATGTAPVNIAVIKYWGKRDTSLILPTNSSLSVTLDQDHLRSTTTSRCDPSFEAGDKLWLNGKEDVIKEGGRLYTCIREMRALRAELEKTDSSLPTWPLRIASYNNFPTAAGLASSASGLAALVASLSQLFALPQSASELSRIARQGSGSACRSLFGGYVAWREGSSADGSDSLAEEVAPQSHWPEMHAVICVVSDAKKGTSSTAGMQRTVATSPLLQHRLTLVPGRMAQMEQAIKDRDFETFAKVTMADSNQFHAVCLDTAPPIFYLNDVSRGLIALVEEINRASVAAGKGIVAAYTFDAGPNCVIYALQEDVKQVLQAVLHYFPQEQAFADPLNVFDGEQAQGQKPEGVDEKAVVQWEKGAVKGLIHTKVGDGPRRLGEEEGLLKEDGTPKTLA